MKEEQLQIILPIVILFSLNQCNSTKLHIDVETAETYISFAVFHYNSSREKASTTMLEIFEEYTLLWKEKSGKFSSKDVEYLFI